MKFIKKNFLNIFLVFYITIGSVASINTGISHDELHEQENWKYNVALTKHLTNHIFLNTEYDLQYEKYTDKYYGIGFQIVSQPIQLILKKIIIEQLDIDTYGAHLTAKHFVVFLFYCISGIFLYRILKKIINDEVFCSFTIILYFLYPYLFGQSLFSPKDIPFLSLWIISTYLSFVIFEKLLAEKNLKILDILVLSFSTALLLSIRIAGVLILFQYLITFLIFMHTTKKDLIYFIKKYFLKLFLFVFSLLLFTYIFYPIFWLNPLSIVDAIKYMGSFYNDVCTLTMGSCMHPNNLSPTYIPIWLSVKLPLIVIIGIFLIPFSEKKIFTDNKKKVFFGTILITIFVIPLILIFKKVHLYDELRQIMFLVPFFFITGLISFYFFSKKTFYIIGFITLFLFVFENIRIHPYQYAWFNLPSRFIEITKKFEIEYQGISGKELAKEIKKLKVKGSCLLVSPAHTVKPYLNSKIFNCFGPWQAVDTNYPRPFIAVQHVRNIKKGRPYKCEVVYKTGFRLLFHDKKLIAGKLLECS